MKYQLAATSTSHEDVAPGVGAWVEIERLWRVNHDRKSPPVWGRGLKCLLLACVERNGKSPPVWGRGLKFPGGE